MSGRLSRGLKQRQTGVAPEAGRLGEVGGQRHSSSGEVWHLVADGYRTWYRLIESDLAALGFNFTELRILRLLSESGSCPMGELARDQMITAGGITGIVDGLEAKGLIERRRSKKDRRIVNIAITRRGERVLERGLKVYQNLVERSIENLSSDEKRCFLGAMQKMVLSLKTFEEKR